MLRVGGLLIVVGGWVGLGPGLGQGLGWPGRATYLLPFIINSGGGGLAVYYCKGCITLGLKRLILMLTHQA